MEVPTAAPGISAWVHWLGVLAATCAAAATAAPSSGAVEPEGAITAETTEPARALPEVLSSTGLYLAGSQTLQPEVLQFVPQYPLWSDGATKRRYLRLPRGTHIDGSNPHAWVFPIGTRFWKEFSLGRRVETRYIERRSDGSWTFASYAWDEAGREARLVPEGGRLRVAQLDEGNLQHDIPSRGDCLACHDGGQGRAPILGFGALQLSAERDPGALHAEIPTPTTVDLEQLIARGLVRGVPGHLVRPRIDAGSATERATLGYLHANCAGCHNAHGALADLGLDFEQRGQAGDVERVLGSIVSAPSRFRLPAAEHSARIVPGAPEQSVLSFRLGSRNLVQQMPPLGSKIVDQEAKDLVAAWIRQMNPGVPLGADQETP
jgi:hypothetical protein